jgi:urea transport system permease protein
MSETMITPTVAAPSVPDLTNAFGKVRGWRRDLIPVYAGVGILLVLIPALYGAGAYDITAINKLGRYLSVAIVALGIDLVWGYAGILTLCQAMFFCFGGYAIGMHLAMHGRLDEHGVPQALSVVSSVVGGIPLPEFWKPFRNLGSAVALGIALTGIFAYVFGYFAFRSRVRGVYFSIITQATTLAATLVFSKNEMMLCGTNGLNLFGTLAGFDLDKPGVKFVLYLLSAAVLILVYVLCLLIVRSRTGRLLKAVRDNESRLRFAGYQPVLFKTFVFTFGAILAAVGGILYTPQNGIITPAKMKPEESIFLVVFVAVGGRGTLLGAVVGALTVSYMQGYLTSAAPQAWPFFLGGLFIVVTLLFPEGIVGTAQKYWARWRNQEAVT